MLILLSYLQWHLEGGLAVVSIDYTITDRRSLILCTIDFRRGPRRYKIWSRCPPAIPRVGESLPNLQRSSARASISRHFQSFHVPFSLFQVKSLLLLHFCPNGLCRIHSVHGPLGSVPLLIRKPVLVMLINLTLYCPKYMLLLYLENIPVEHFYMVVMKNKCPEKKVYNVHTKSKPRT
jgi:hypothetical protein